MPDPSSAIARLRPARQRRTPRRESHRFVTRAEFRLIVLSDISAGESTRPRRSRASAWTLYARWHWTVATARTERARRRARPTWR